MTLFFFLILWCSNGAPTQTITHYSDTAVYQVLVDWEVAVGPNEDLYVINYADAFLWHYDASGNQVGKIGRKGRGPGEFTYPYGLWVDDTYIYVFDMLDAHVSRLNRADTSFVDKFSVPNRRAKLVKVDQGWLVGDWFQPHPSITSGTLVLTDETFERAKTILTLDDIGHTRGSYSWRKDGQRTSFYSPISTRPQLIAGHGFGYVADNRTLKITRIDGSGDVHVIQQTSDRIPFDVAWADDKLIETRKHVRNMNNPKKQYPDYFPAIRELWVMHDGTLVVDLWRGRPDDNHHLIAMDQNGDTVPVPFNYAVLDRLLAQTATHLYLRTFDTKREEGGVVKVHRDTANAFVEANELQFDGSIQHNWSISL